MIVLKENIKDVKEFNSLYDNAEWGAYDEQIVKKSLDNTIYSVSVYDNDKIIGYGRLLGDDICFIYIQDVIVKKEYQMKGIGTKIINKLLEYIENVKKENKSVRVYVGASKGKEEFYKKFGFVSRKDALLGDGMILKY